MTKNIFCYLLLLLTTSILTACGGDDGLSANQNTNSTYDQDEDQTTATIDDNYVYQLPVIFHVLYTDNQKDTEYVSATRLKAILNNVNELFAGNIYGNSQNIKVNFVLATKDANGNTLQTPGVRYIKWDKEYPIAHQEFMTDNSGTYAKYIWNPNEYINIMVYNFKSTDENNITLGVSHTPYTLSSSYPLDGLETIQGGYINPQRLNFPYCLSINSIYINKESSRYTTDKGKDSYQYRNDDINATLAHELGHFLGIFHTFTEIDNQTIDLCQDTDFCTDTPSYNKIEYDRDLSIYLLTLGNNLYPNFDKMALRTNCSNLQFQSTNIMDYAVSEVYEFTAEQKMRMRHVLYYSPLIPGPKKNGVNMEQRNNIATRSSENDKPLNLPIRIIECKKTSIPCTKCH